MAITFERGDRWSADGTSLQGYIRTTYDALVAKFGQPDGGSDKTTAEWVIEMYDEYNDENHVVTIYDWKEEITPLDECDWHIGAQNRSAVECFARLFPLGGQVRVGWR